MVSRLPVGWAFLCTSWSAVIAVIAAVQSANAASITSFTPQGTVKDVRQVRAQFSDPMVNFGDPRAAQTVQPFEIRCTDLRSGKNFGETPKFTQRWADAKNWILDFDQEMPAGLRCEFQMKWETKTLDGKTIDPPTQFALSTGGPSIRQTQPYEGSRIEPEAYFVLFLDAPASRESVLKNAYFVVSGIQERVPLEMVSTAEQDKILQKSGVSYWLNARPAETKDSFLVVKAKRRFPESATVELVWGAGITTAAKGGLGTTQDQRIRFAVIDPFRAEFQCGRENEQAQCNPMQEMFVRFTRDITAAVAKQVRLRTVPTKKGEKAREWTPTGLEEIPNDNPVGAVGFKGPFPAQTPMTVVLPGGFKDDLGRALVNASSYPLSTGTGDFSPLAKFAAPFGIIEQKAGGVLPVTLRNLESPVPATQAAIQKLGPESIPSIAAWLDEVYEKDAGYKEGSRSSPSLPVGGSVKPMTIPRPNGAKSFEVVGIPLKEPGFYQVELKSQILGASLLGSETMYVAAGALVTNLSVHLKAGRESSLVWVTALDTGKPVSGARVQIVDCNGKAQHASVSDSQGIAKLPGIDVEKAPRCGGWSRYKSGLFALAAKDGDFSFVHTSWAEGIESWRFNLPGAQPRTPLITHTVLDRSLFRAGETVHMKHVARHHQMRGFASVPEAQRPKMVAVVHVGSGEAKKFPVRWSPRGEAEMEWKIPTQASLGLYRIVFLTDHESRRSAQTEGAEGEGEGGDSEGSGAHELAWLPGTEFRVEEFRVPLMRASIQPVGAPFVGVSSVPIDLSVSYLAGGGASKLPVIVRHKVRGGGGRSHTGFDEFTFSNGKVTEGKNAADDSNAREEEVRTQQLELSASGTARAELKQLGSFDDHRTVYTELEFADPNGEVQTISTNVPVYGSSRVVGIKSDSWFGSAKEVKFEVAVATPDGKPVANAPVSVDLFQTKNFSHRKRLAGGFYGYDHFSETKKVGKACEGQTNASGILRCETTLQAFGSLTLQASVKDPEGRRDFARASIWAYDRNDEQWFGASDHDRIDLLPAKKRYEPGETAKFQVRMPFKQATALVTLEREGVIESFVRELTLENPTIEVPIRGNHAPNVFVSALVVRGRVAEPKETALVDLARPAFKLGIAEVNVGWKAHELKIELKPERTVYQVREKAKVRVRVTDTEGKPAAKGSEVTLAAVDQGLLELWGNSSWDLLPVMMARRGYELSTFTAQSQVIGKRHFGLKALPTGGDGGGKATRELFDTLLLWKATVPLDAQGVADVEIPLNDSLTEFKIVAVALGGADRFGTGSTSIRVTQDLMVLPGVAPLAREGDRLRNEVTLRNSTQQKMRVAVEIQVQGLPAGAPLVPKQQIELGAGEAKAVHWEVTVPSISASSDQLIYTVSASSDTGRKDRVQVKQSIRSLVPVRTLQATIAQLEGKFELKVEKPADALVGRGGVGVILDSTLASSLEGVRQQMRDYPFTCLEQRLSRAVALEDRREWNAFARGLEDYQDGDGLFRYFPSDTLHGSDVLTAYVLSLTNAASFELPKDVLERALIGLASFIEGRVSRSYRFPTADLSMRKVAAAEALSRHGRLKAQQLTSIEVQPNLWPTQTLVEWMNLWRRQADFPNRAARLKEAEQILAARVNFQGTKMMLSTAQADRDRVGPKAFMMSSTDLASAYYLHALLDFSETRVSRKDDLPRLIRGVLARQQRGHWDLTTANAWGSVAVRKFVEHLEKTPVSGESVASLGAQSPQRHKWAPAVKASAGTGAGRTGWKTEFAWPEKPETVVVTHQGAGKPWVTVQSRAAIPLKAPLSTGYKIKKSWAPVIQKKRGQWTRGDVVRVRVEVDAQTDMNWVVLNDPMPAGSTVLGSGLARNEGVLSNAPQSAGTDWWSWPTYVENSQEGPRAYYEFMPKGKFSFEYSFRLNQPGVFGLPTTRVEAMYAPELFGELPNAAVTIAPE
jgi:uncharacterized protein YfaS (alpha-2-macroglobulin family)